MLPSSAERIRQELPDHASVLDVGGWASPFDRADWVLDLMPYETRGLYGYEGGSRSERFDASRWVTTDICSGVPWPFEDDQFDFAVCSHTLEDVRDPVWVCQELSRVAKAGYIETPSRAEEQCWGVHGPWVGWSHHRWLVDVVDDRIRFAHKPGILHSRLHYPAGYRDRLAPEDRVLTHWWNDTVEVEERFFFEAEDLHAYLREVPDAHLLVEPEPPPRRWVVDRARAAKRRFHR